VLSSPAATPAQPDRPTPPSYPASPKNAISIQLVSLLNSGVAIQYERFVGPPRVSLAGSVGYRQSGGTDYDVVETTVGTEARIWFIGKDGFSHFADRGMVGPYIGLRVDLGLTRESESGRTIGSSIGVAEALQLGARIAIAHRFEVTPSIGTGLRTEFDPKGRLAAWTRQEILRFGVTAGVMF
jgi:hypothetical protein